MKNIREFVTHLQLAGIELKQGELMCRHTSFQIGGPVAVMVFPHGASQLEETFRIARSLGITPMIMGAGSNILAPDRGLDTAMVETRTHMTEITLLDDCRIQAQCGITLTRLAVFAMENGLTGLEFAHGIPGTLGGGVYMNAGAYGGEMAQVIESVTLLKGDGTLLTDVPLDALGLSYRHSRFMDEASIIVSAVLKLEKGDRQAIREKMTELMGKRKVSQPLEYPSAGSTFKRPATGYAAALIDEAGLKGLQIGDAQVSEKHAGFVINRGRATCKDVLALMEEIKAQVSAHSGVLLEPEVQILEGKH